MGLLALLISLFGLMYLAYRGISVLILAPLLASLAVALSGEPVLAFYTQVFMPALGGYLLKYFPIFALGAIFGRLMSDSGAARSVGQFLAAKLGAERAIFSTVAACAILTYGGVSLFVVAFCMYPIAKDLFSRAKVSLRLIPGAIALGSFTFTMTALPGTPSIQNAIPMPFFGTTAFAAPLIGIVAAAIMAGAGYLWLNYRANVLGGMDLGEVDPRVGESHLPNFYLSVMPLILVILLNYIFSKQLFPLLDLSYLQSERFGTAQASQVIGLWALISALVISILVLMFSLRKYLAAQVISLNTGVMDSLLPIFNTASEVGYGATIAALPAFALVKSAILGIFPQWPLISEAISINVLAGITGSASGGLSIALEALGANYLELGSAAGLSPEVLHRVASLSCGGFDTLPHNGAVITLLGICAMTHKKSYFDIFMVAVIFPFLATIAAVVIGSF